MMPGMNQKQMKQAMKRMGMQQEDIDAVEVVIRTPDKEIVFSDPQVAKVNAMGQDTWQITGNYEEREIEIEISEDDVKTVCDQTGVDEETARNTIKEYNGDLTEAIMKLQG